MICVFSAKECESNPFELQKPLKLIMAASKCKTVQELQKLQIIPWYTVKKMDPVNFANTRKLWWSRLYTEIHIKKVANLRHVQLKLVKL
jgi:hypothetical protein